jgi:hypothetical protein
VRTAPGIEIPRDHDADRLDPAGHVEHGVEAAFGEDLLVLGVSRAARRVLAGLLDPQEFETLVVLVAAARHRREVIATATRVRSRSRITRPPLSAAAFRAARTTLARAGFSAAAGSTLATASSSAAASRFAFALAIGAGGVAGTGWGTAAVSRGQWFVVGVIGRDRRWPCDGRIIAITIGCRTALR